MKKLAIVLGLLVSSAAMANTLECNVSIAPVDSHGNYGSIRPVPRQAVVTDNGSYGFNVDIDNNHYTGVPMDDRGGWYAGYDSSAQVYFMKSGGKYIIQSNHGSDDVALIMYNCK